MAVVTSDYLAGVLTNFRALFAQDFQAAMGNQSWPLISSNQPSNGAQNTYTWFGTVPTMEDVTHGIATRQGLNRYNFTIQNNEWQVLLEVERAAYERDQLGLVRPRISQLSEEAARHPGQLIFSLFEQNPLCFSGGGTENWIADAHTIGAAGAIDNQLAGTGTAGGYTVAQFQTDLGVARGAMRAFRDDQGRPMNLIGNVIVIPASIEQVVYQALNANQGNINQPVLPGGSLGSWSASGYLVIVNPYLTDTNNWYLMHVSGPNNRPFIYQTETPVDLASGTNPNEQAVIEYRKFIYSAYARYNVGVTDPRFVVKTVSA